MRKYTLAISLIPLLFCFNVNAEPTLQCVQAPDRTAPCENLIYSSFRNHSTNVIFCLCKSDKQIIQAILSESDQPNQQKLTRQLVSRHRMTTSELALLLNSVAN